MASDSRQHRAPPGLARALAAVATAAVCALALPGCGPSGPVRASRELLGTAVSATAYTAEPEAARAALDRAFAAMERVETELDPYDATSAIAAINAHPFAPSRLPTDATGIYRAIDRLGVGASFSPALWGVTRLYDFGGEGAVPDPARLAAAVAAAGTLERRGDTARFTDPWGDTSPPRATATATSLAGDPSGFPPGFDFGGASKGLAIDRAATVLADERAIAGVLLSAGSSTLTLGRKDGGGPWRIGVEDPRGAGSIVATIVVRTAAPVSVSTSGDYQTFFERGGTRYHHILDPATGRPARGMRSLTVFGPISSLDADILSTALFVMGRDRALAYARTHALGLVMVDGEGEKRTFVPASWHDIGLEVTR